MKQLLILLLVLSSYLGAAQQRNPKAAPKPEKSTPVELISAASLETIDQEGIEARRLISSDSIPVVFRQGDMQFTCKTAIQFPDSNFVAAFGDVFIERGDSIELKGDTLLYYGNERFAEMRENVYFTDQLIEMRSPYANYDLSNDIASYQYGAVITDTTSTLKSQKGYYYTRRKLVSFRGDVILDNPKDEYHIETDTLTYNTLTQTAYFHETTLIKSKDGEILAQKGRYQTEKGKSYFQERVELENADYIIAADILDYDENRQAGYAKGKVKLYQKKDSITIYGDMTNFDGADSYLEVFGNGLVEKPFGKDTLFLAADTLQSMQDSTQSSQLLAYSNVKLFTEQIEGTCDSLSYQTTDSLIEFFQNPIMWTGLSQLTADTLVAYLLESSLDQLRMRKNAFIISEDSIRQYDQVKGRNMLAQFENDYIKQVDVNGNGQSIYFALENGEVLMGMNRVDCSNMIMRFQGANELNEITFIKNPDAKFIPPHELSNADLRLPDFAWRVDEKPGRQFVDEHIFRALVAKPLRRPKKPIIPKNRLPRLEREEDLLDQDNLAMAEMRKRQREKELAKQQQLSEEYGQQIANNGFRVFLKDNTLTFYLAQPTPTRVHGNYYVDIIPVSSNNLSEADRKKMYETRVAVPTEEQAASKPFVLQIALPEYPFYTIRFGQYTVEEDKSKKYQWTEAWNR